jgi:aerobic-type carbon monoxide dehydrogenase small subunit (CoxS/CutS family)
MRSKVIETVEGIAHDNHPIIEAYKNNNCMQCGYCTPGFICTAKALLDKKPNPSEEEILNAISGNLCRCATYPMHPIAIQEAAAKLGGS